MTVRVLVVRAPGTNCDFETVQAFRELSCDVTLMTFSKLVQNRKLLHEFNILVFPGGFSYGDYVRAGAILGKKLIARLGTEIRDFLKSGGLIVGICNGFQILVEAGLIPGTDDVKVALTTNVSLRYECRWTILKYESKSSPLSNNLRVGSILRIPVGHGEGRVVTKSRDDLKFLIENDLVLFRYAKPDGTYAEEEYPWNPNGSIYDIAGLQNIDRNVIGMMPHPERAFYTWQLPDWTRNRELVYREKFADGYLILKSLVDHASRIAK
ncbi:MAG: phosphoribosylformylglycinamidine synthase I [Crenarchaeota archaeon]|nr:phosphoribosylformylglycinamidine synthase I [Thermoproteota archaeon]